MLEPVKEFLKEIREHIFLVKPLLKESLSHRNIPLDQSHLVKFIESATDLVPFFEQKIRTTEDLKMFAIEFKSLFGDIEESMSPEAKQNYEKFVEDIRKKRMDLLAKKAKANSEPIKN